MIQSPRSPKPKFIPPIKTALSFLKSISENTDHEKHKLPSSPSCESPSSLVQRAGSTIIKTSISSNSLQTTIKIANEQNSARRTRDISHLQDILTHSKSETERSMKSVYILPTNIEQLKAYMSARISLENRVGSKKTKLCFKERCLENFIDNDLTFSNWNLFNDRSRQNNDLGSPTGLHEVINLKLWYKTMKEKHFANILEGSITNDLSQKIKNKEKLESLELIIKAGLKECIRQVTVQCYERGEILFDLFQHLNVFWKIMQESLEASHKERYDKAKAEFKAISQSLADLKSKYQAKEITHKHEIEVLSSDNLLKKIEIDKLKENIKKLKGERIYRNKLELERHNVMINKFKELKEFTNNLIEDPYNAILARTLQNKKEDLVELIKTKIKTFHEKNSEYFYRLNEKQLIEHEMLSVNTDCIFTEKTTQTEHNGFTCDKGVNAVFEYEDAQIETEDIFETVIEQRMKKLKKLEKPEKNEKNKEVLSILITNDKEEQVVAFHDQMKSVSSLSSDSDDESQNDLDVKEPQTRRVRVSGFFKSRVTIENSCQTDEDVFIEMTKRDEEELLNWMIRDRQDYLKDIQKQIQSKRSELNNFETLAKPKNLGEFLMLDESRSSISANSFDNFDFSIDVDLEYLRKSGIINKETDLMSWREGYNYGLEKRKSFQQDGIGFSQSENIEKPENLVQILVNEPQIEKYEELELREPVIRNKLKRTTLGLEDIKRIHRSTKIKEFRFQRKEGKHMTLKVPKKNKFLDGFLSGNLSTITRQSKMSRKMIIKTISLLYTSAINKTLTTEFDTLAIFIYDEFCAKYGQKKVAVKKIVDFMSGLLKYPDSRRVVNFLKLLGISYKLGLEDFCRPKQSFNFFISLNRLIDKSKLGIMSFGEISDYQLIPAIRAIDCTKELLSCYFDSSKIQTIIGNIEKSSHPDPKKINKFGIVDLEFLQEILLLEYDLYNRQILEHMQKVVGPFSLVNEKNKIHKLDGIMLIRHLNPMKYNSLLSGKKMIKEFSILASHDSKKATISLKRFYDMCFNHRILHPGEIEIVLDNKMDETQAQEIINSESLIHMESLKNILRDKEKYKFDDLYVFNWEGKLELLAKGERYDLPSAVLIWRVLGAEVKQLLSDH